MTYKPGSGSSDPDTQAGDGLRGPDKQQDERRVQRNDDQGAPGGGGDVPGRQATTPREAAQGGADLRAPTGFDDDGEPEGLRRERQHPLNPKTGRSND